MWVCLYSANKTLGEKLLFLQSLKSHLGLALLAQLKDMTWISIVCECRHAWVFCMCISCNQQEQSFPKATGQTFSIIYNKYRFVYFKPNPCPLLTPLNIILLRWQSSPELTVFVPRKKKKEGLLRKTYSAPSWSKSASSGKWLIWEHTPRFTPTWKSTSDWHVALHIFICYHV